MRRRVMTPPLILHLVVGLSVVAFLLWFAVTAAREHTPRAMVVSGFLALGFAASWCALGFGLEARPALLWIPNGALLVGTALFFLPFGRPSPITKEGPCARVDERDVLFAREEYEPGGERHARYYAMRPEHAGIDDKIRAMPPLLAPGGRLYDPVESSFTGGLFRVIEGMTTEVDGPVSEGPPELSAADLEPVAITARVKEFVKQMGGSEVGIAPLDPDWVYSHVGRGPEEWGAPIETPHRFAIVFSLEMAYEQVRQAPGVAITTESANQYLRGASISVALAEFLRNLGFSARAHVAGSNYQIMLPPIAQDAGLGELARFGYLVSGKLGARVRLGAVTTELELIPDAPRAFGIREFCEICKRCATNCPSSSIPAGEREEENGVVKWTLEKESCLRYWRFLGSDCGLCMKVCPYAHPRTFVHEVVRAGVRRSPFARWVSTFGEDLFYGRTVKAPRRRDLDR